uniref:Uncharacterized protein n=1 Tax=Avena sativa TaxID=4498 RepID=A0ACD5XRN1_AVESA
MWEGGVHGSHHEAAARLLTPWFGAQGSFGEPVGAAVGGGFGVAGAGGYGCDVVGQGGMFGFGFEAAVAAAQQQQQQRAAEVAAAGSSKAVVAGLLGSLQAEMGRANAAGEIMDAKALAASRSHSEAERRRRQRINGHLARLRSLLPNTTKTDKASLLAEVLEHVKELKRQTSAMTTMAAAAVGGDGDEGAGPAQMLPTEADELAVDAAEDGEGRLVVRASLCCEDRPDLIPDIIRALAALRLHAHRAEITTLGGRVRSVLLITQDEDEGGCLRGDDDGHEDDCAASHSRHERIASVQEALRGVIDRRAACSNDTSSSGGGGGSIKRQRMNYGAQEHCSV